MNKTGSIKAIILAAGRGSRMKEQTADRPKCLLELAGKPLLQWQLQALRGAGIADILVVRGYLAPMLTPAALPFVEEFHTAENIHWESSNMLRTLLCADTFADQAFSDGAERVVVSYADIVYPAAHVRALAACPHPVAITYDMLWEPLWRLRFGDPLLDAETFKQENGLLREIGGKPHSLHDVQGQYMGLLSFTQEGWNCVRAEALRLGDKLDTTDMTGFLRGLLGKGIAVGTVPVQGRWCEADNGEDLRQYEHALAQGHWSHDWRDKQ